MSVIADNIAHIRARAGHAKLIAVSKGQSAEVIGGALAAGQRVFGENRVQEAQKKFSPLKQTYPDIELHLIGQLQTNKARDAVELFDTIQTLDREKLADALAKAIRIVGRAPSFYIEINIGAEPQKAGIAPEKLPDFLHYCRDQCGLSISGLMCVPPLGQDPKPSFTKMRQMADLYALPHLSMGMSGDFEDAIACGATEIRVGKRIFEEH